MVVVPLIYSSTFKLNAVNVSCNFKIIRQIVIFPSGKINNNNLSLLLRTGNSNNLFLFENIFNEFIIFHKYSIHPVMLSFIKFH